MLTNRAEDWDSLDLASLPRRSLRQQAQTRGPSGPQPVHVDAAKTAGAVRPQGAYSVAGQQVDLKINLIRDKQNLGHVAVQGSTAGPEELERRSAGEIARVLQTK